MSNQTRNKVKIIDDFIASILVLFDNIKQPAADPNKTINIMMTAIQKQYLTYYTYRIWIKYRSCIENAVTKKAVLYVLNLLNIPEKYQQIYITYPMVNKMPSNEKVLDLILFQMLQHFHTSAVIYSKQPGGTGYYQEFTKLTDYLLGKTIENIIQDILQIKMLLPNLSRPSEDFFSWDEVLPLAKSYEAASGENEQVTPQTNNTASVVAQTSAGNNTASNKPPANKV